MSNGKLNYKVVGNRVQLQVINTVTLETMVTCELPPETAKTLVAVLTETYGLKDA